MQNQTIFVLKASTMASLVVLLLIMVDQSSASHGSMNMNRSSLGLLILPSLDHTPTHTPGNGCNETGNGGNPCKPPINGKAFAGRQRATVTTASPPPLVPGFGTTTNRKLKMESH